MSEQTQPDFSHMDFDDNLIDSLWRQIKAYLRKQGGVYTYDMVENNRLELDGYSEDYIRNRVLPAMRERLEEQQIIDTKQELGENNTGRLVWIPGTNWPEGENS